MIARCASFSGIGLIASIGTQVPSSRISSVLIIMAVPFSAWAASDKPAADFDVGHRPRRAVRPSMMHDDSEHRAGEEAERDDGEPFLRGAGHGAVPFALVIAARTRANPPSIVLIAVRFGAPVSRSIFAFMR